MEKCNKYLKVWLTPGTKKKLEKAAEREQRSQSNLVRVVVEKFLAKGEK